MSSTAAHRPRAAAARADAYALWRRWTVAATVGEIAGFAVPAVAGALTATSGAGPAVTVPVLVAAGFGEGAALGFAQSRVVRGLVPGLRPRAWTLATAASAAGAWLLGMLPSSLADHLPGWALWSLLALVAPALLASIGLGQWLVLRRHRPGSAWWIAATAGAWAAGLTVFVAISSPLWGAGQSAVVIAAIGVAAGAAMAVTAAALTGLAAVRLARDLRPGPPVRGGPVAGGGQTRG